MKYNIHEFLKMTHFLTGNVKSNIKDFSKIFPNIVIYYTRLKTQNLISKTFHK